VLDPTPEELLRQSERRFQALLEKSWDAVSLLTADGTVLYASPSTTRILGYDPKERVGRNAFADIHPDDLARVQMLFARLLDSPGGSITASFRCRHLDDTWRWVETTGTNLLAEPAIAAIVTNYHDITEHIELEQTLREQAKQLAQADRHKDEFLAVLAHELRNPLGSMRNAIAFLQRQGPSTPELQWANDLLDRQVQHLTGLVDDLLDLSRVRHGKIALRKEVVELSAVVAHAVETSRPLLESRRQHLTVAVPQEPLRVEADPGRLDQVVGNLMGNAAKYTCEEGRIWLSVERDGGEAVLRVRDTGVGIPAELLPRLFELFMQGPRPQGGLGIGLTLVKQLVELHGGNVQAFSDGPGRGSEFVVRLPALVRDEPATAEQLLDAV